MARAPDEVADALTGSDCRRDQPVAKPSASNRYGGEVAGTPNAMEVTM
jgi:hypothetical protein